MMPFATTHLDAIDRDSSHFPLPGWVSIPRAAIGPWRTAQRPCRSIAEGVGEVESLGSQGRKPQLGPRRNIADRMNLLSGFKAGSNEFKGSGDA